MKRNRSDSLESSSSNNNDDTANININGLTKEDIEDQFLKLIEVYEVDFRVDYNWFASSQNYSDYVLNVIVQIRNENIFGMTLSAVENVVNDELMLIKKRMEYMYSIYFSFEKRFGLGVMHVRETWRNRTYFVIKITSKREDANSNI